ncbi:MAG: bifunctional folylpolyglutamate synthase/dihydrofolate synthase, partial [Chloroflexota bacterium]
MIEISTERPKERDLPLSLYRDAEEYVHGLISGPVTPDTGTPREEIRRRAVLRMERLKDFLRFLGDPHLQYRTIHVGGTSGKGSTSALIASVLSHAGYRTGLHVSPYLQVATEKLMLDGRIASARRYHDLVMRLAHRVEEWIELGYDPPTYGEFWVALTFRYFADEAVDYAVIEVGAGGRFDLTNVIQPDVAAITSVGFDHMITLGSTLPEIAWHKAGILKRGAAGVTSVIEPESLAVIEKEAAGLDVDLVKISPGDAFRDIETSWDGTSFFDVPSGQRLEVALPGTFQATNAALAAATVRALPEVTVSEEVIGEGLRAARFPGRMEIVQRDPLVLLDGAHNPEKIGGLCDNLTTLVEDARTIVVFGVLESKSYADMLARL